MNSFNKKIVKEYRQRLKPKINSRKIPQRKINRIIKLTKQGLFRGEIAGKLEINPSTVWKYQKENGLIYKVY